MKTFLISDGHYWTSGRARWVQDWVLAMAMLQFMSPSVPSKAKNPLRAEPRSLGSITGWRITTLNIRVPSWAVAHRESPLLRFNKPRVRSNGGNSKGQGVAMRRAIKLGGCCAVVLNLAPAFAQEKETTPPADTATINEIVTTSRCRSLLQRGCLD